MTLSRSAIFLGKFHGCRAGSDTRPGEVGPDGGRLCPDPGHLAKSSSCRIRIPCSNTCTCGSHPVAVLVATLSVDARGLDPCSRGSRSPTRRGDLPHGRHPPGFRSLFSWITLTDAVRRPVTASICPGVSILVLVDHPRRPASEVLSRAAERGFRSLFSWITLVDLLRPPAPPTPVFRSLFSWITLVDSRSGRRWPTPRGCFDPGIDISADGSEKASPPPSRLGQNQPNRFRCDTPHRPPDEESR